MIDFKPMSQYEPKEGDIILAKNSETSFNVLYVKSGYFKNQLSLVGYDGKLYLSPKQYAIIKQSTE
jgi:hypothetical protein